MSQASKLTVSAAADRALTPQQRRFNQLVRKIEQLRAELAAWQEQAPLFAQAYEQRMRPLRTEWAECRKAMVRRLDQMLAQPKGWTAPQRRTLREVLCNMAGELVEDEHASDDESAEFKALHDRHADTDFDTGVRNEAAAMKAMIESMSGVDLGDGEFDSPEELLAHAQDRLQAEAREQAQALPPQAKPAKPAKPSAAARRREAEAAQATQSLREVYRKLASALHPDRAAEGPERARRTALMQRVNRAYDGRDLLALFALQLEIEQVDAEHLARATAERAQHYNRVLAEQRDELQAQIDRQGAAFCAEFGFSPYARLNPAKLGPLLEREVSELRSTIGQARRDLRQLDTPIGVKRWIVRMRCEQSIQELLPFGLRL